MVWRRWKGVILPMLANCPLPTEGPQMWHVKEITDVYCEVFRTVYSLSVAYNRESPLIMQILVQNDRVWLDYD
jgi:hypothetical protein